MSPMDCSSAVDVACLLRARSSCWAEAEAPAKATAAAAAAADSSKDWQATLKLGMLFGAWYLANIYFNM